VVKVRTEALEEVRKDLWREMRKLPSPTNAGKFLRGKVGVVESRNSDNASGTSSLSCQATRGSRSGGPPEMKESLRAIFAGDLEIDEVDEMLDRWCGQASKSETTEFHPTVKDHPNAK
jgi:hypothetical protein